MAKSCAIRRTSCRLSFPGCRQVLPDRARVRLLHRYRRTRMMILRQVQQQNEVTKWVPFNMCRVLVCNRPIWGYTNQPQTTKTTFQFILAGSAPPWLILGAPPQTPVHPGETSLFILGGSAPQDPWLILGGSAPQTPVHKKCRIFTLL